MSSKSSAILGEFSSDFSLPNKSVYALALFLTMVHLRGQIRTSFLLWP